MNTTANLLTLAALLATLCASSPAQDPAAAGNPPAAAPSQLPPASLPDPPAAAPAPANPAAPAPADPAAPAAADPAAPPVAAPQPELPPRVPPPVPAAVPAPPPVAPVEEIPAEVPVAPDDPDQDFVEEEGGWRINDANLNDIFQFLAKAAGRQYFHNTKLATAEFKVTGHLNEGNPLQQMEDLGFMYGLTLYTKGDTIYALTEAQLTQLPSSEFHYQLSYLRPTDMDQIKELIKPVLSAGSGVVNFEPKTNTIVIIDSVHHIEMARDLLTAIDRPKGQVVVETKILRINSAVAERVGIDWSGSLGESGASIEVVRSLNSVFGLPAQWGEAAGLTAGNSLSVSESPSASNNIVLSPFQLNGVLRALSSGGIAHQISNPTLITEDNEQANISIIDRVPIITTTSTLSTAGPAQITEEVRYKIDAEDPTIATDPDKHREVGISLTVTPTVLPDGTVRMKLRPRSAQIAEQIRSAETNNLYPRVTEAMIESTARVPDGHSLVVGGFYGEIQKKDKNKVPILGDIPLLNFFFKSNETEKEHTSLVFIVTPTSYSPTSSGANSRLSQRVEAAASLPGDHDWIDPELNPGPAHEANMRRTLRGARNQTAPYYPTAEERRAAPAPRDSKPRFSRARRR